MLDLETILNRKRMIYSSDGDNGAIPGFRNNRLFGLNDLIKENLDSESVVCELGSHVGSSSALFAYYCKLVYCIDVWTYIKTDYIPEFENDFDKYVLDNFNNVVKIKSTTIDAVKRFLDNSLDLVYVDADHEYESVKEDINNWLPKIKKGGFIAGHDFYGVNNGVEQAVIETIGKPDKTYEDSSWIKRI